MTNGETTDYAHASRARWPGRRSSPRAAPRAASCSRTTRRWFRPSSSVHLPFALGGRVGRRPGRPRVRPRARDQAVLPGERGPVQGRGAGRELHVRLLLRRPQPVRVLAKRSLGDVTLKYNVNGGAVQRADAEWNGERLHAPASSTTTRSRRRHGTSPVTPSRSGSRVVASAASRSPTRRSSRPNRSTHRGRQDYTGPHPCRPPGPKYLEYYVDALAANGVGATCTTSMPAAASPRTSSACSLTTTRRHLVHGRRHHHAEGRPGPATPTGCPGRDARVPRVPQRGQPGALHRQLGRGASTRPAPSAPALRPQGGDRVQPAARDVRPAALPAPALGSGDGTNDVLQYWFGAYLGVYGDGRREGEAFDVLGSTTRSPVSVGPQRAR